MKDERSVPAPATNAGRSTARARLSWWLPALAAWLVAQLLRLYVVEPSQIGYACDPAPWSGWCAPRTVLLWLTFGTQALGWIALGAGVVAMATRWRLPIQLALVVGMAGLVLYCFEPAAVGVLLGALASCRRPEPER